jgi:cardiolipin synthase
MLHSKTAVADGLWARVGSSNLNVASWLANYELDAVIENADFAETMTRQYEVDLANSTEVVLGAGRRKREGPRVRRRGSAGRAAVLGIRLGNTLTAAVNSHRAVEAREAGLLAAAGGAAIVVALLAVLWPRLFAIPFAVILAWLGGTLLARAWRLRRGRSPMARRGDD